MQHKRERERENSQIDRSNFLLAMCCNLLVRCTLCGLHEGIVTHKSHVNTRQVLQYWLLFIRTTCNKIQLICIYVHEAQTQSYSINFHFQQQTGRNARRYFNLVKVFCLQALNCADFNRLRNLKQFIKILQRGNPQIMNFLNILFHWPMRIYFCMSWKFVS